MNEFAPDTTQRKRRRATISVSHVSFSVLYVAALFVVCNALTVSRVVEWFPLGDGIDIGGLIAFYVFGFCVSIAFFILFAHRWTIKPMAVVLLVVSTVATYFISKYNIAVDRTMLLNVVHTDATEARSLLSVSMIPYIVSLIVLPIVLIARTDIRFRKASQYLPISLAVFLGAIGIATSAIYLEYNSLHRAANISHKHIIHVLVPVNVIRSVGSIVQRSIQSMRESSNKDVEVSAQVSSHDDLVVVLAVGETTRQKSFSLYGYDRKNTNPVLSQVESLHILNGKARIGTTLLAIPEILERDDVALPAVTSKVGIETSCLVNYTLYDSCAAVGEIEVDGCGHGGKCYDEDVLPMLADNLKSYESGYRFVLLHFGGGSHGPSFHNRHPPEFLKFAPQCFEADVVNHCTLEELYNSYDNTVLYVDYVVGKTIETLDASGVPYVFVYLSDHGESLLEDGRLFHGMPPGIPLPPEQADIPLIVKSSVPITIAERDEYTQQDVYDSVLGLFSIETDIFDKDRAFISKR
jgi:lipid A ethanolaminephosphotransferase